MKLPYPFRSRLQLPFVKATALFFVVIIFIFAPFNKGNSVPVSVFISDKNTEIVIVINIK